MDTSTIKLATNKSYTEFSSRIKDELHTKLNAHDVIDSYNTEYDNIQDMKTKFASINQTDED